MPNLGRYFRTLRHTRASQLLWRARYALERKRSVKEPPEKWCWKADRLPRLEEDFPSVPMLPCQEFDGQDVLALLEDGTFRHLNRSRRLGRDRPDWLLGNVHKDRLWTVTLHYHEWAYR